MDYKMPSFYLKGYVKNFEQIAEKYHLHKTRYPKGTILTTPGVINNTTHYICNGILHLTLTHSSGNQKGIGLFGAETIFPLGVVMHENPIDYEMILTAITDIEVYSFSYPQLRQICVENGEFAAMLLEENCDFVGYLFYQEMNQSYSSSYTRICDLLYIYNSIKTDQIIFSQSELANLAGISIKQLEKVLKDLREQGIIETAHRKIIIKNSERLLAECSDDLQK